MEENNKQIIGRIEAEINKLKEKYIAYEVIIPQDYKKKFWKYHKECGRTGSEINKLFGINRKTAEVLLRKAE